MNADLGSLDYMPEHHPHAEQIELMVNAVLVGNGEVSHRMVDMILPSEDLSPRELLANRVGLLVSEGRFEVAIHVLRSNMAMKNNLAAILDGYDIDDVSHVAVAEIGLPVRLVEMLERVGILWLSQLLDTTEGDLMEIQNMGQSSITRIRSAVADYMETVKQKLAEQQRQQESLDRMGR